MTSTDSREEQWLLTEGFNGVESTEYFAAREKLRNGEPLAYLIGTMPFGPLTISLDSKPLIPRAETEFWVTKVLHELPFEPKTILDLCAGSGCIGVLALHTFPSAHVDFAELDETHHETIRKNIEHNNLPLENTSIRGGDLFAEIPTDEKYDLMLTNPPYIDPALDRTQDGVKAHEPHLALYGGADGMEIIERIIHDAKKHLTKQGILVIEHEPEQCSTIKLLTQAYTLRAIHMPDQYGTMRYTIITQ
ncbi:hypothetical protein A3C87_01740 [Candidatus Kaiserbacteria bacterium RIFCSPHIGHO2_02_FULL_49_34]|uniref:peptide chain release factor N(5)-glutamine methyltransferase n=1 Tax=Candidatus Kaiserbacteria bacterium RIFCSPHIGHO2_02_FULL_49_34 TaxID=1798491 RepID=A0A1F6DL04_9BACT|nr:MAG: hypothetical protein A3C87_01740 [Candidatus Kaiserbacteria bacterium RIFCSPHIGHO2_02_FULL_49_34]